MGWWRVTDFETGGISCDLPSGHPNDGKTVINAVPGRDPSDDCYGGDMPADVMDQAIKTINGIFANTWHRDARPEEVRACFNFCFNGWKRRRENPQAPTAPGESGQSDADPA